MRPILSVSPSWCLYACFSKRWLIYLALDKKADGRLDACPREPGLKFPYRGKLWQGETHQKKPVCRAAGAKATPLPAMGTCPQGWCWGPLELPLLWQGPGGHFMCPPL